MEIFGKDIEAQRKLLDIYESKELLFSPLRSSTLTAKGQLTNVNFNEEDYTSFDCTMRVLTCNSNYTHNKYEFYDEALKKKSNRGRKKKIKRIKTRKIQGTGDCMNSQIQFGVTGQHIRRIPDFPDKHSKEILIMPIDDNEPIDDTEPINEPIDELNGPADDDAEPIDELINEPINEPMDEPINEPINEIVTQMYTIEQIAKIIFPKVDIPEGHELVIKKYIFLVFRNGRFTLPGVLTEDLSDAIEPVKSLCEFLSREFWGEANKVQLQYIQPTMRNYKFQLLNRRVDLLRLQKFCSDHFHTLLNIHFRHVRQYLIEEISDTKVIDYVKLKKYLIDAPAPKNLYVSYEKLKKNLNSFDIMAHYKKIGELADLVYDYFSVDLDDELIQFIWSSYIGNFLHALETRLKKDKDNLLSHIKFDPEKYPGFIIKIKTPLPDNREKRTTIKLFKSGKIDIDGANNRQEAEFIYLWLNSLFVDNRQLTYNPNNLSDDENDEYSFSAD
jgi:hypothetical protein